MAWTHIVCVAARLSGWERVHSPGRRAHVICIWEGNEKGRTDADGYRHEFDTTEILDFASHPWDRHVHV